MGRPRSTKRVSRQDPYELKQLVLFEAFPNIPRSFTLFGHQYSVVFVDDLIQKRSCFGHCDAQHNVIELDPSPAPTCVEQTFWHAVLHAITFCLDIKLSHRAIEQVAQCLHQVLSTMSREGQI